MSDAFTAYSAQTETLACSTGAVRSLEIVEANIIANHTGTGMILVLGAHFIDEECNPHAEPFEIEMPLEDANDVVQERGQRTFAALRRATGVLSPQSTDELLFKPFRAIPTRRGERVVILNYLWDGEALAA